jgi:hypothetical protein
MSAIFCPSPQPASLSSSELSSQYNPLPRQSPFRRAAEPGRCRYNVIAVGTRYQYFPLNRFLWPGWTRPPHTACSGVWRARHDRLKIARAYGRVPEVPARPMG